jgi:hypothetical protein
MGRLSCLAHPALTLGPPSALPDVFAVLSERRITIYSYVMTIAPSNYDFNVSIMFIFAVLQHEVMQCEDASVLRV